MRTLPAVADRALALTDRLCWDSLDHADAAMFARQAVIGAELYEFGICAGLLVERRQRHAVGCGDNNDEEGSHDHER